MVGTETMDDHDWDALLARYVHFNVIERMRAGEVPKVAS